MDASFLTPNLETAQQTFTKDTSMQLLKDFIKDESGATAIEYGLIAGLIAVVIIGTLTALGGKISALFGEISEGINKAGTGTGGDG